MPHYGLLRNSTLDDVAWAGDIRGSNVYGRNDEKLGKINDVIFDHSTGAVKYVVVDTGGWFSHKMFLVPPHRLHASAEYDNAFVVNLGKDQIEGFPPYNEKDIESPEKWQAYDERYEDAWHVGPVLHREGSDHDVTPTPDEMPAEPGSIGAQLTPEEQSDLSSRVFPAAPDEPAAQSGAGEISSRWMIFEDRLRQRRHDLILACPTCSAQSASDMSSESAEPLRKAS